MNAPRQDDRTEDTLVKEYRHASALADERPDARVRAAVLREAAARGNTATSRPAPHPPARWPLGIAAALIASVAAGLVVTRAIHDEPDRIVARVDAPSATVGTEASAPPAAQSAAAPRGPATPPPAAVLRAKTAAQPPTTAARPKAADAVVAVAQDAAREPAPAADRFAMDERARETPAASPPLAKPESLALRRAPTVAPSDALPPPAADARARAADTVASQLATPPAGSVDAAAAAVRTPEAWIAEIVALRRAGRDDDADRELAALRKRYPEVVVPTAALGTR